MNKFSYFSKVAPGQLVNLMAGLKPNMKTPFSSTLLEGTQDPINDQLPTLQTEDCYFGPYPLLIPCSNWSQLVSEFFSRFKIKGRLESFAGAAVLQKHSKEYLEAAKAIANYFNIQQKYADDNSGYSFVLARVSRNIPNAVVSLSLPTCTSFRENLVSKCTEKIEALESDLKKDEFQYLNVPESTEKALQFMKSELGSHYIETVEIGDEAFQIFVYTADNFKLICNAMDKSGWNAEKALGFRYFTSKRYCEYASNVNLLSEDPGFSEIRKLLKDISYNLDESIFNLILNEEAQNKAQKLFSIVCVGAELMPVSELKSENKNILLSSQTTTSDEYTPKLLLNNAAVQGCITRFGAEGAGPSAFTESTNIDYSKLYSAFGETNTVSMLWSPYLSVSQMYVNLDELWKLPALNKTGVKHLIITADVIEVQEDIDLSKVETVTLSCRLFIAGKSGSVPSITLSSSAWKPLRLYCGSMRGTCAFEEKNNPSSHRLVFDTSAVSLTPSNNSVKYQDFFAGKFPAKLFYETETDVDTQWRKTALQTGLETLLMTSSISLTPQASISSDLRQTAIEAWNCLKWITDSTKQVVDEASKKEEKPPEELALIFTHSIMLLRAVSDPNDKSAPLIPEVPTLRYTAYEDAVNRLLDVTKDYARQIDITGKAIDDYNKEIERNYTDAKRDENIKKMAQFILDQNKSFAEHEDDLTESHNEIINKKKETILQLTQREAQIKQQYATYIDKLDEAKDEMVKAITEKKHEEEVKAVLEFAFGIVEIFGGVMTGIYSFRSLGAAVGVERTLKKWEAFMKFAEQANKLLDIGEHLLDEIETISDLNNSTPPATAEPPTNTDWEIFMNDSEAQVAPAEDYIKEQVADYIAALRNLTAVAKSMNDLLDQKAQLNYDIFAETSSRTVSEKQAERLSNLSLNLNDINWSPDTDYLADLGQFNAVLRQKQNSALMKLAEIMRLQNDSMTFYYLSKPTIITQFDISAIQEGLASQALAAVQALETYPYPPTDLQQPIEIKVENVSINQLTSDAGVELQVQMNQGLFNSLAHVRINSLDIRIDGISTDTGNCHVQIETLGNPMLDRGLQRELLSFKMISREWHVVYDIDSNKTIIGTEPAREWGKYFTKPTPFQTYRISLPKTFENSGFKFEKQTTTITLSFMLEGSYSKPPKPSNLLHSSNSTMQNEPPEFLKLLKGVSVTDGWDVVSFVSVDKINSLWKQRWEKETSDSFKGDPTFVQDINVSHTQLLPGKISVEYNLCAKLGPPWLQFVADTNQSALVNIPLIEGQMITTTYDKDGKQLGQDIDVIKSTVEVPVCIKTKALLKKLQGEINENTVYIDPAQDTFILENIDLDPQIDVAICNEIVEYFKKQKLQPWKLGTLHSNSNVDFLKPKIFNFQTYTPSDSHKKDWPAVLALYILTTTPNPPAYGMRQIWPDAAWPVSADLDAAVYFSADLLWDNEIIPTVKEQISDAEIIKDQYTKEYSVQLKGSVQVCNQSVSIKHGWESSHPEKVTEHAIVNFLLSAVTLKFNLSALELSCDTSWQERLPYQGRHPFTSKYYSDVQLTTEWDNVEFLCKFDSSSYPHIDANSFDVTFDELKANPIVDAKTPSHSFLGLPLPQIKQSVVDNAKTSIAQKVSGLKINLKAMPMFAVSNLLFPESKAIEPKGIYCPHDLVLVGDVVRDWKPLD